MNRLLEFTPSPEEAVASRVLVLIHQAIDENFPDASRASRQFTKTIFSEDRRTTTLALDAISDASLQRGAFAHDEVTSPDGRPVEVGVPATAPSPHSGATPNSTPADPGLAVHGPPVAPVATSKPAPAISGTSNQAASPAPTTDETGPDWISRVLIALLLAGVLMLTYLLTA